MCGSPRWVVITGSSAGTRLRTKTGHIRPAQSGILAKQAQVNSANKTMALDGSMQCTDRFGYLPHDQTIEFEGGQIVPLDTFLDAATWVAAYAHKDGFLYPPVVTTQLGSPLPGMPWSAVEDFRWEDEPHTNRPALLHHLPSSHEIGLRERPINGDLRSNEGAFLLNLAAYVFGVRLQFSGWWFDGRIPIKSTHNIAAGPVSISRLFSHGFRVWRHWPEGARLRFTNALYMNSRAPSYEWDWERFAVNYMVFDALYKLARDRDVVASTRHCNRLGAMCKAFGLAIENQHADEIYRLRNELFHEALWSGSQPCTSMSPSAYQQVGNLRRLNQRLLPALLGFQTEYIRTSWSSPSTFALE